MWLYVPSFRWQGFDNQYNTWLKNFLSGNFGLSKDDQTVFQKLRYPLSITLILGLSTLILAFGTGIPLGVFAAINRYKRRGKWLIKGLFAVYSLPTFWLATLAAMFLTTRFYGLKILPKDFPRLSRSRAGCQRRLRGRFLSHKNESLGTSRQALPTKKSVRNKQQKAL